MKISCVMPTADRLRFVPAAIECFLMQMWHGAELVIVDDGRRSCEHLVPIHPRIHYVHYDRPRLSTGAKRNLANQFTTGDVIIHWDDDDWSHPDRIGRQIAFLQDSGKQVVGYHDMLYYREKDGAAFHFSDLEFRPNAAGSSLCYFRSWWKQHPFADRKTAEDFLFCANAHGHNQLAAEDNAGMLVARSHGTNTCQPPFGTRKYPGMPVDKLPLAFRQSLIGGSV